MINCFLEQAEIQSQQQHQLQPANYYQFNNTGHGNYANESHYQHVMDNNFGLTATIYNQHHQQQHDVQLTMDHTESKSNHYQLNESYLNPNLNIDVDSFVASLQNLDDIELNAIEHPHNNHHHHQQQLTQLDNNHHHLMQSHSVVNTNYLDNEAKFYAQNQHQSANNNNNQMESNLEQTQLSRVDLLNQVLQSVSSSSQGSSFLSLPIKNPTVSNEMQTASPTHYQQPETSPAVVTKQRKMPIDKDFDLNAHHDVFLSPKLSRTIKKPKLDKAVMKKFKVIDCYVCGQKSSGFHYGAFTCEACKLFFRRTQRLKTFIECKSKNCNINDENRKCTECRYKKCIAVGMSMNRSQFGRHTQEPCTIFTADLNKSLSLLLRNLKEICSKRTQSITMDELKHVIFVFYSKSLTLLGPSQNEIDYECNDFPTLSELSSLLKATSMVSHSTVNYLQSSAASSSSSSSSTSSPSFSAASVEEFKNRLPNLIPILFSVLFEINMSGLTLHSIHTKHEIEQFMQILERQLFNGLHIELIIKICLFLKLLLFLGIKCESNVAANNQLAKNGEILLSSRYWSSVSTSAPTSSTANELANQRIIDLIRSEIELLKFDSPNKPEHVKILPSKLLVSFTNFFTQIEYNKIENF